MEARAHAFLALYTEGRTRLTTILERLSEADLRKKLAYRTSSEA